MTHLDYLNQHFPIRKSVEDKKRFRNYIIDSLDKKGIVAKVERTKDGKNDNVIVGDPTKAKAVFVAHYDTPARSIFPNIMIPKNKLVFYSYQFVPIIFLLVVSMLFGHIVGNIILNDYSAFALSFMVAYYGLFFCIMRGFTNKFNYNDNTSGVATVLSIIDGLASDKLNDVAFILFDNEEKGKKGSAAYFKDHKQEMQDRFVLNFDCVGNGDHILFIAQPCAFGAHKYKHLQDAFEHSEHYIVEFCSNKEANSNSDHKNFTKGVACVACKKTKHGLLYTPNIHTHKDIVADNANIDFLSKKIVDFVNKLN